jgi:hypothetical protein
VSGLYRRRQKKNEEPENVAISVHPFLALFVYPDDTTGKVGSVSETSTDKGQLIEIVSFNGVDVALACASFCV